MGDMDEREIAQMRDIHGIGERGERLSSGGSAPDWREGFEAHEPDFDEPFAYVVWDEQEGCWITLPNAKTIAIFPDVTTAERRAASYPNLRVYGLFLEEI